MCIEFVDTFIAGLTDIILHLYCCYYGGYLNIEKALLSFKG